MSFPEMISRLLLLQIKLMYIWI